MRDQTKRTELFQQSLERQINTYTHTHFSTALDLAFSNTVSTIFLKSDELFDSYWSNEQSNFIWHQRIGCLELHDRFDISKFHCFIRIMVSKSQSIFSKNIYLGHAALHFVCISVTFLICSKFISINPVCKEHLHRKLSIRLHFSTTNHKMNYSYNNCIGIDHLFE